MYMKARVTNDFGTFEYTVSPLEEFADELAKAWDCVLSELFPPPDVHQHRLLRGTRLKPADRKRCAELVGEQRYAEAERVEAEAGIIRYTRKPDSESMEEERRELEGYTRADYIHELYSDNFSHEEELEITKGDKRVRVEINLHDEEYTIDVHVFCKEIADALPTKGMRELSPGGRQIHPWAELSFMGTAPLLDQREGTPNPEGDWNNVAYFLRKYFGVTK